MLYEKRPCQPLCKAPDKRDFQSYSPEKSDRDFYENYDPMVGVGTAAILLLVIVVITMKVLVRWSVRHWRRRKYTKRMAIEVLEKRVSFMEGTVRLSLMRSTKEIKLATTTIDRSNNTTTNGNNSFLLNPNGVIL